jgi:hypothetical protein
MALCSYFDPAALHCYDVPFSRVALGIVHAEVFDPGFTVLSWLNLIEGNWKVARYHCLVILFGRLLSRSSIAVLGGGAVKTGFIMAMGS